VVRRLGKTISLYHPKVRDKGAKKKRLFPVFGKGEKKKFHPRKKTVLLKKGG